MDAPGDGGAACPGPHWPAAAGRDPCCSRCAHTATRACWPLRQPRCTWRPRACRCEEVTWRTTPGSTQTARPAALHRIIRYGRNGGPGPATGAVRFPSSPSADLGGRPALTPGAGRVGQGGTTRRNGELACSCSGAGPLVHSGPGSARLLIQWHVRAQGGPRQQHSAVLRLHVGRVRTAE